MAKTILDSLRDVHDSRSYNWVSAIHRNLYPLANGFAVASVPNTHSVAEPSRSSNRNRIFEELVWKLVHLRETLYIRQLLRSIHHHWESLRRWSDWHYQLQLFAINWVIINFCDSIASYSWMFYVLPMIYSYLYLGAPSVYIWLKIFTKWMYPLNTATPKK